MFLYVNMLTSTIMNKRCISPFIYLCFFFIFIFLFFCSQNYVSPLYISMFVIFHFDVSIFFVFEFSLFFFFVCKFASLSSMSLCLLSIIFTCLFFSSLHPPYLFCVCKLVSLHVYFFHLYILPISFEQIGFTPLCVSTSIIYHTSGCP